MSFLYSNNFLFKNDVAANVTITKKKKKKIFGMFFPLLGPWDRKLDKYWAVHKSLTELRYKLENWYVFLDIEDTCTVAKQIQWSTLLLSYYKINFSA